MTAYYNIPARQGYPSPVLQGAYNVLKVINDFNEQKKKNQQERAFKILDLSNKVDFVDTISIANKSEQVNMYNKMMDSLVGIVKQGKSRDGSLTVEDMMLAQQAIKTFGMEISKITQGEKWFHNWQQELLKNGGEYDPRDIQRQYNAYVFEGEQVDIQKTPILPEQWMPAYEKGLKGQNRVVKAAGDRVTTETYYWNSPEQQANSWMSIVGQDERKQRGVAEKFKMLQQTDPEKYNKYVEENFGNVGNAAMSYGINEEAVNFGKSQFNESYRRTDIGKTQNKQETVQMTQQNDGSVSWTPVTPKKFIGTIETFDGKKISTKDAYATSIGYKDGVKYVEFVYSGPGKESGKEVEGTVLAPYSKYKTWINSAYNLEGIDMLDTMKEGQYKPQITIPEDLQKRWKALGIEQAENVKNTSPTSIQDIFK